jgi:hypothetical protein
MAFVDEYGEQLGERDLGGGRDVRADRAESLRRASMR